MAAEERMQRRFPQPVRVGDLIGLPVLDDGHRTLGFVRQVVRTPQDKIELIVAYSGWFGWLGRASGRGADRSRRHSAAAQIASLDMPRSEYAAAPTWQEADATALAGRRQHPHGARPALSGDLRDHDLVKRITFWCVATCRG